MTASFFVLANEALEGGNVVVKIFVVVDVVELNIGDQRVVGMIRQEMPLEFARLENEMLRIGRHMAVSVADQIAGRVPTQKECARADQSWWICHDSRSTQMEL